MNTRREVLRCLLCSAFLSVELFSGNTLLGGATRSQQVLLKKGWNAVFLEVDPADPAPTTVFARTPVDIAASFYAPASSAQFVSNPSVDLFKMAGWGVWYAENRPDAFLKTLHAVNGRQAYLVH